jgi:N-acetylneuraminate synthase/N,N'-diacetyllegionaminate synthase
MVRINIKIGDKIIGDGQPIAIVAEIGNNHNGDIELAKKLIEEAAKAGCDMVKFQTHIAEAEMLVDNTIPPHFPEPRWEFTKRMGLSKEDHIALMEHANKHDVIFFSSPFSKEAIDLLDEIGVPAFKVASGEITNIPMLEHMAKKGKPIIMSSGMSTMEELEEAVGVIRSHNDQLILMHCTSKYPCPYSEINLNAITKLRNKFELLIGFSDHNPKIYAAVASVPLGVCMIEKHFTTDKTLYGPDHKASLEPIEMQELVEIVHNIESAMGTGEKNLTPELERFRAVFQKSVVSLTDIQSGNIITESMVSTKKPGTGLPPKMLNDIIGKKAKSDIPKDSLIKKEDIEW